MASFDAQINLIVNASQAIKDAERAAKKIQGRLDKIQAKQGAFFKTDVALEAQLRVEREIAEFQKERINSARSEIAAVNRIKAATERRAALEKAINRAGVSGARRQDVDDILAGLQGSEKNLKVLLSSNAALEKILQTQREINRTELASEALQRRVRAYGDQINALEKLGSTESKLTELREKQATLSDQQGKKQLDLAKQTEAQLKQQIKLEQKARQLRTKGFPASPIRGTATMAGSPVALRAEEIAANRRQTNLNKIAREEERIANKRLRDEDRVARIRKQAIDKARRAEDQRLRNVSKSAGAAIVGGGFPLLFGGGPGGVLGGLLGGAIGGKELGFEFSIGLSALGTQLDKFGALARNTGDALKDPTKALDQLDKIGVKVDKSVRKQVEALVEAGQYTDALNVVYEQLSGTIGNQGINNLKAFDDAADDLQDKLAKLALQVASELAPALTVVFNLIGKFVDALSGDQIQRAALNLDPVAFEKARATAITKAQATGIKNEQKLRDKYNEFLTEESKAIVKAATPQVDKSKDEIKDLIDLDKKRLDIANARVRALQAGRELTSSTAVEAQKNLINAEFELKFAELKNQQLDKTLEKKRSENIEAEKRLALEELAQQALDAQIAQYQKLLGLQNELIGVALGAASLDVESAGIAGGKLAAITEEYNQQDAIYNLKARALQLDLERTLASRTLSQQERELYTAVYQEQLKNLEKQTENKKRQLQFAAAQLKLERELQQIKGNRESKQLGSDLNRQISDVESRLASPFSTNESELLQLRFKQTRRYEDAVQAVNEKIEEQQAIIRNGLDIDGAAAERVSNLERQLSLYEQLLPKLNALEQSELKQQQTLRALQPAVSALASGMSDVVTSLIDGTSTVEEAVSRMFANIGKALIDYATQAIAIYALLAIWRVIAGVSSGSSKDAIPSTGDPAAPTINGFDTGMNAKMAAEGAYWTGGFQAFANGGMVTSPTMGLVGEGGEPEYIIPASKMRGAMNRYAAGARGSSVIPGSGEQAGGEMGGGTAVAAPIDVRYTVERINSVDYVTADQFRSGMQQAAEQGARRGEQRTLANIRQNTTTRRKLGL